MPPHSPTPTLTVYGIPNCDTVRKARAWLSERGVEYVFHDFKKQGVPEQLLPKWLDSVGDAVLINRKGPTWRGLPAEVQHSVVDATSAIAVMREHSSTIKRPVVQWPDGTLTVGFDVARWAALLEAH